MTSEEADYEIADLQKRLDIAEYDKERFKEKITVLEEKLKAISTEPCEDAISREAALNSLIGNTHLDGYDLAEALDAIENTDKLPPVTPKPKTGRWIAYEVQLPDRTILNYRCSVCGRKLIGYNTETLSEAPFCHCGAKMEETI